MTPENFLRSKAHGAKCCEILRRLREAPCWPQLFPSKSSKRRRSCSSSAGRNTSNRFSCVNAGADGQCTYPVEPLAENLTLLSGPGGNVVVLNGPDGKIVVDTFLMPAWPKLKKISMGSGNAPLKTVIDTRTGMSTTRTITPICTPRAPQCWPTTTPRPAWQSHTTARLLGLHFPASPADALPQQTFSSSKELHANGEIVMLQYFQPAHHRHGHLHSLPEG